MRRKFFVIISFVLLLSDLALYSQIIQLSAGFEKDSLLIGEQTKFYFRVVKDKSVDVNFPILSDTLTKNLEILQSTEIDTILTENEISLSQTYLVTSFDTGQFYVPSFPFTIEFGEVRDTLYSSSLFLHIGLPEIDINAEFRDIKAPVNTPLNFKEILPYAGTGLIGLALIAALFLLIRKVIKKKDPVLKEKDKTPPYIIALKELQEMLERKTWEKETIKEFYTHLSGIVRTYLEDQFGVPALELTTQEILPSFEKTYGQNPDIKSKLEELLQLSDLVKFAKEAPLPDENIRNIDKAILFVELTKPSFDINNPVTPDVITN